MNSNDLQNLSEAYNQVQLDEAAIYKRGGKGQTTETPLQIYGKSATAREKKKLHNIPKGRIGADEVGDYDRGSGNAANRRAAALTKPEAKKFPNRLTRSDKQGIKDSYEYDLYDIILSHLLDEGYADTEQAAEAIMVNMSEDWRESIVEEVLDEAEGSYGQTPKAQQKMDDLANKRRNTPASEYSERGEKKKKVDAAVKHSNRMSNPDAGDRGKKSTKPHWTSDSRKGMTQKDRDWSRGADEYGHSGYDGEGGGGSLPKGKKLERQRKTGVSESYDLYDIILSHLIDEGYASSAEAADKIILNMSESWFEDIMELNRYEKETGKDYKTGKSVTKGGTMGGDDTNSKVMRHMHKVMGAGRMGAGGAIEPRGKKKEPGKKPAKAGEYGSERRSPEQIVKNRRAKKQASQDMLHSRYD